MGDIEGFVNFGGDAGDTEDTGLAGLAGPADTPAALTTR